VIELVVVANAAGRSEWDRRLGIVGLALLQLAVEFVPFAVKVLAIFLVLRYSVCFASGGCHLQSLFEGVGINLFKDGLECNQRLLENLMPVILSQVNDDWHKHWECFILVGLQYV